MEGGQEIQAVILAGGQGRRLRPITETLPNSLVPIRGRPFLDYQLGYMRLRGIDDVILCLGYRGDMIAEHCGDGRAFGLRIRYGYERDRLLGTAGAVKNSERLLAEAFFVVNGDTYPLVDFARIMTFFLSRDRRGLMVVIPNQYRGDRGNIIRDGSFVRVYSREQILAGMSNSDVGVSVFRPAAFAGLVPGEPADLATVYHALIAERQLLAYETPEGLYDIGSHEGLREFEAQVLSGAISLPDSGAAG